jgi:uncharacterized protein YjiS (DUF1127 family)
LEDNRHIFTTLGILVTLKLPYTTLKTTNADTIVKFFPHTQNPTSTKNANRILSTIKLWQSRSHGRRHLAAMDSRLLADAGITEAQRSLEIQKPFWRE